MRKMGRGRDADRRRKRRNREFLVASVLTTLNLLLSIALRISDRKRVLQAIEQEDNVKLLYAQEKTTQSR